MTLEHSKKFFSYILTSFTFQNLCCRLFINTLTKRRLINMKKFRNLLVLTLCFAFMVTTVDTYTYSTDYEISPLEHHNKETVKK